MTERYIYLCLWSLVATFFMSKNMRKSTRFVKDLIHKVNATGCLYALSDLIQIIELNVFYKNFSRAEKIVRFDTPNGRKLIEVVLTYEEIGEIARYFLLWAGLPKKVCRGSILFGLRYFPGEISVPIILEIIQKYGDELTNSNPISDEVMELVMSLTNSFFLYRNFDDEWARGLLTEMNPIPFLEKYTDCVDVDFPENDLASYAKGLMEDFTHILEGYIYNQETNELQPPTNHI